MSAVKEMTLIEKAEQPVETEGLTPQDRLATTVQALAANPHVDVEKLERIIQLQERMLAEQARQAFNVAMSLAQQEMGPIVARGWNPETKSRYRKYEDIDRVIRPIYTKHGFAMSFNEPCTDKPDEIRVTCTVSHCAGHERPYGVTVPSDGKGIKGGVFMTRTHATGSGLTYGKRYLADLIWNLAMTEDDDGNRAGKKDIPEAPAGYDDWLTDLEATAADGLPALESAWKASKPQFRRYRTTHQRAEHDALKQKAEQVGKRQA